ncbi:hypothetical protein GOODEAATRI_014001 [Goodea atripinnis]|uniref:Uncharacterized protein n=1 Tax=Goodea atripinnis TaxID=208336 RepID=A0ABV0NK33_9TELE
MDCILQGMAQVVFCQLASQQTGTGQPHFGWPAPLDPLVGSRLSAGNFCLHCVSYFPLSKQDRWLHFVPFRKTKLLLNKMHVFLHKDCIYFSLGDSRTLFRSHDIFHVTVCTNVGYVYILPIDRELSDIGMCSCLFEYNDRVTSVVLHCCLVSDQSMYLKAY